MIQKYLLEEEIFTEPLFNGEFIVHLAFVLDPILPNSLSFDFSSFSANHTSKSNDTWLILIIVKSIILGLPCASSWRFGKYPKPSPVIVVALAYDQVSK